MWKPKALSAVNFVICSIRRGWTTRELLRQQAYWRESCTNRPIGLLANHSHHRMLCFAISFDSKRCWQSLLCFITDFSVLDINALCKVMQKKFNGPDNGVPSHPHCCEGPHPSSDPHGLTHMLQTLLCTIRRALCSDRETDYYTTGLAYCHWL